MKIGWENLNEITDACFFPLYIIYLRYNLSFVEKLYHFYIWKYLKQIVVVLEVAPFYVRKFIQVVRQIVEC